jgi:hypothetical protein
MGRILNMTIITGLNPLDRISGKLDFILAKNPEILKSLCNTSRKSSNT